MYFHAISLCTLLYSVNQRQVCVDNMTPVNGADVRMLRSLIAQGGFHQVAKRAALVGNVGGGADSYAGRAPSDTTSFLDEWLLAEETEETTWRSFRAAANVHLNTALPYDLHVLKVNKQLRLEYYI